MSSEDCCVYDSFHSLRCVFMRVCASHIECEEGSCRDQREGEQRKGHLLKAAQDGGDGQEDVQVAVPGAGNIFMLWSTERSRALPI